MNLNWKTLNNKVPYLRGCTCTACNKKRAAKLRIRGPVCGGLWKCYLPYRFGSATGMNPEQAYYSWLSFNGGVK